MTDVCEVIVVGAGPAGTATAAVLAAAGKSVVIVDKAASFPRDKACAEYASPAAENVLRRLGVWSDLESAGVSRLQGMIIVGPSGQRFRSEYIDGGQRRHSFAVPRLILDNLLLRRARGAGVECRLGLRVEGAVVEAGRVVGVRARGPAGGNAILRAPLVVAADGVGSRLSRQLAGGRAPLWPRRLGLATHFRGLDGLTDWGEMYVSWAGYCGLAPLGAGLTSMGAAVRLQPGRGGRPAARLSAALSSHPAVRARLERATPVKRIRGVGPLAWKVSRVAGPGFLLVGDAAGFFDPFTGEGIYRALRGAELAAECALETLRTGDWQLVGRSYVRQRRAAFAGKERLAHLLQEFVRWPPALEYAFSRLERRPALAEKLSAALGDLGPPGAVLNPAYLIALLRP